MIKKKNPSDCYPQNQEEQQVTSHFIGKRKVREQAQLMGLGDEGFLGSSALGVNTV